MLHTVYLVDAVRTPVGKRNGVLKQARPDDLLSHTISALIKRNPSIDATRIDDVIVGCAFPEGSQGLNVARISLLLAGLPEQVPGYTINRFCASGLQAVANAAFSIQNANADMIIAAGTESMTQIPMSGHAPSLNPKIFNDQHIGIAYGMGMTAEKVVAKYKISQQQQNEFALASHQRAIEAQQQGFFDAEIASIQVERSYLDTADNRQQTTSHTITSDEGPRADTSLDALNNLRPAFHAKGTVTAGNSSQMSDGAASVLMVSERAVKEYDLKPIARFISYHVAGVAPEIMGIGPIAAIPPALQKANLTLDDIDWIELNEAFAAQSVAVINELQLNQQKVNPVGGAIALGHPLGATGAIRTATLLNAFKQRKIKYGMISMCIGTGMGAAGVFENLHL